MSDLTPEMKKLVADQLRMIVSLATTVAYEVVKPSCRDHAEKTCRDYPHCAGCNAAIWEEVK